MHERLLFLKSFLKKPARVGALFPSSKHLARNMVKYVAPTSRGRRYLEVGAGSGALTPFLIANLSATDQLDLVEIDPKLCKILRDKFSHYPGVHVYQASIIDFDAKPYDAVIASLPFNSFSPVFVEETFVKLKRLVKRSGVLSYFEYIGLQEVKKSCLFGRSLQDFQKTLAIKKAFTQKYCYAVDKIWRNLPPARIFHCRNF